jgi:23S rRNA (cytidine1920-2'-O)/16S rRNA (cytidine1409-2'-O)-methyltransferase
MSPDIKGNTAKQRLDMLLVDRGFVESREQAKRLIMAGEVTVDGQVSDKPGKSVPVDARVDVRHTLPYVSRGGIKLAAALDAFAVDVTGAIAADIGASTGGFTDCLLQHGAAHVYAIDVGYGQLAWKLRSDSRVTVLERTNARYLEYLPGEALVDLAVVDASFISLELILPAALRILKPAAAVIALVKPQFEAGREQVGKGGVVRDERVHRQVLEETWRLATGLGLGVLGMCVSPLLGPAGNTEFLIWLRRGQADTVDAQDEIAQTLADAQSLRRQARSK